MKVLITSPFLRQYLLVLIVNLSVFMSGMSIAWPSPMFIKLMSATETPLYKPITSSEGSWIVSLGFAISAFSNVIVSNLLDNMGRKFGLMLFSIIKLLMAFVLIFAMEYWLVLMARTIMIMTDCYLFIIVSVYASEVASKTHRGSLGTLIQVFSCLGILTTLSAAPFLTYYTFSYILCGIWTLCTLPLMIVPESPYYQFTKGKYDAALKTLISIRETETLAKQEIEEYKLALNGHVKVDKVMFLKNKTTRKSLILAILLIAGSQCVGCNAVMFYLQTILISTNTKVMPEMASVIIGLVQVVASLSVILLTRILKRKLLLLISLGGIFLGLVGLGIFFEVYSSQSEVKGVWNFLPIASLILVVFCFNAGIGALIWPIATELFEGPARTFGVALGLVFSELVVFLTSKYFSLMTSALGPAPTYWIFSANCVILALLIIIFLPETKDKSFEEIQMSLGKIISDKNNVEANRA